MTHFYKLFLIATLGAMSAQAQPQLTPGLSAMNAASFVPAGLPQYGVAPGSRVALLGKDFGFTEPLEQTTPESLVFNGVSAKATVGGSTADAYVMYVSATRIEVLLPADTPVGTGTLAVTVNGTELSAPMTVVARAAGIRTRGGLGSGTAVALNPAGEPVTALNPAAVGEIARISTTGLGAETGGTVEVLVAGKVVAAGPITRQPNGYDDLDFEMPAVDPGCGVAIALRTESGVSNFATIPVGTRGTRCFDPAIPEGIDLDRLSKEGVRIGAIGLSRSEASVEAFKSQTDAGAGTFFSYTPSFGESGAFFTTTIGACTLVRTIQQDPGVVVPPTPLDAGPSLPVSGPGGGKTMTKNATGSYSGSFGEKIIADIPGFPGIPGQALYLDPGTYTITGSGGADVGAFSASITVPQALTWTNADTMGTACGRQRCVTRSQDLKIDWTPGDDRRMVMLTGVGSVANTRPAVTVLFICTERADKGTLTVPSAILSALPLSPETNSTSALVFTVQPITPVNFTASGIDVGTIYYQQTILRTVGYR